MEREEYMKIVAEWLRKVGGEVQKNKYLTLYRNLVDGIVCFSYVDRHKVCRFSYGTLKKDVIKQHLNGGFIDKENLSIGRVPYFWFFDIQEAKWDVMHLADLKEIDLEYIHRY